MTDTMEVLQTFSRDDANEAVAATRKMSGLASLLAACIIESGGSFDLSYESMGQGVLADFEMVCRPDKLGITLRLKDR